MQDKTNNLAETSAKIRLNIKVKTKVFILLKKDNPVPKCPPKNRKGASSEKMTL